MATAPTTRNDVSQDPCQSDWLLGRLEKEIPLPRQGDKLPTKRQVLSHFLYCNRNYHQTAPGSQDIIIREVITKVERYWQAAGIKTLVLKGNASVNLLKKLVMEHSNLRKNKTRNSFERQKTEFETSLCTLFDIASPNAVEIIRKDRLRTQSDIDQDLNFLIDQRTERKMSIGPIDKVYGEKVEQKLKRDYVSTQPKEHATPKISEKRFLESDSSEGSEDSNYNAVSPKKKLTPHVSSTLGDIVKSPSFNLTADRLHLSVRQRTMIAASAIKGAGMSIDSATISTSTAYRETVKARNDKAISIKNNFVPPQNLILHWDGKKMLNQDSDRQKKERLMVCVSGLPNCTEGKLLGAPLIQSEAILNLRLGRSEALSVYSLCEEWNLVDRITGMCFDTTATNSGHKNGSCTIFEREFVGKKLLWLACRHHIYELILKNVYKSLFGKTTSPDNDNFKFFRDVSWQVIDTTRPHSTLTFKTRIEKSRRNYVVDFYLRILRQSDDKHIFPRNDYRECTEVMLQILGEDCPRGPRWYKPGAIHQARWMTAILYPAKIFAFQDQIEFSSETLWNYERLCKFNALYYVPAWLCSSNSCDAPTNDLELWRSLATYKRVDLHVADAAMVALERQLWYLSEELAVFAIFSSKTTNKEKTMIIHALKKYKHAYSKDKGQPVFPIINDNTRISSFIFQSYPALSTCT